MEQPSGLCCHSSMSVDSGSLVGRTPLDRLRGRKEGRCWVPQERSSEFFQMLAMTLIGKLLKRITQHVLE